MVIVRNENKLDHLTFDLLPQIGHPIAESLCCTTTFADSPLELLLVLIYVKILSFRGNLDALWGAFGSGGFDANEFGCQRREQKRDDAKMCWKMDKLCNV